MWIMESFWTAMAFFAVMAVVATSIGLVVAKIVEAALETRRQLIRHRNTDFCARCGANNGLRSPLGRGYSRESDGSCRRCGN